MCSRACFMTLRLAVKTLMVLTKAFWLDAIQTCSTNQCFILLRMAQSSTGPIAFLSAIKWMHPTTVSATATYLQYQCTCVWLLLLKILTSILLQHCRSQAALACPMWAKQCDHIPQRSLVQTLVLVVLANLATGPVLAQATLG